MITRCLLPLAVLAGCDLTASGSCEAQLPTWRIPVDVYTRVAAQSLPDGSLVLAATDPVTTVDGTTVPIATLARIDPYGSIVTIGATLSAVPDSFSLTGAGAGVTLLRDGSATSNGVLLTFSESLQVVWTGEMSDAVAASTDGHIAYHARPETLEAGGSVHVRTLDGNELWTTQISPMAYIYDPQIQIIDVEKVFVISGYRYEFDHTGLVDQRGLPFYASRMTFERDGSTIVFGTGDGTEVGRADATWSPLWSTGVHSIVSSVVLATNGDVLAVRAPGKVVRLDSKGREIASHENCAPENGSYGLGLLYADADGYVLHDGRGIARYEGP